LDALTSGIVQHDAAGQEEGHKQTRRRGDGRKDAAEGQQGKSELRGVLRVDTSTRDRALRPLDGIDVQVKIVVQDDAASVEGDAGEPKHDQLDGGDADSTT